MAGLTDERISEVSVLYDVIEISVDLKTCDIFSHHDVNEVIT